MESSKALNKKSLMDVRLDLDALIHISLFFSVLLIGADKWGFHIMGVNVRVDQFVLCIFTFLLVLKGEYRVTKNIWILLFLFSTLFSSLFGFDSTRGIIYYFSILYNIIFIFYSIASYVGYYGLKNFISVLRATCYVQTILIVIQFLLKVIFRYELPFLPGYGEVSGIPRFQLWFYEPSYLATYISFWFALSLYMLILRGEKSYITDTVCCLIMFVISTSTSGFIAIALTVAIVYFIWLSRGITMKKMVFPVVILFLFFLFRFAFNDLYSVFIERLFSGSIDAASGGRVGQWLETFQVFQENPFFGVGPGNYGAYLGKGNEYVSSNVTLDVMATLGIFGFICWAGLTVSLLTTAYRYKQVKDTDDRDLLMACIFGLIIFTIILQFNQGYLRLYHWMFFGVIWGGILRMRSYSDRLEGENK